MSQNDFVIANQTFPNTRADINRALQALASNCWDKCIKRPDSTMSSSEADCVANCAGRYIDTQKFIVKRLSKQGQQHM